MKKITFEIRIIDGENLTTRPWEGYQSQTPGLVVNRNQDYNFQPGEKWNITHKNSGLAIGPSWNKRAEAAEIARRLGPLTDWTQTQEELGKIDGLYRKYNQIVQDWRNGVDFSGPEPEPIEFELARYGYSVF